MMPFAPMLLGRASTPPSSPEWTYEVKYDGWRAVVDVQRKGVTIWSRNGHNITERFSEFRNLHRLIAPAVLDCEVVVLDDEGRPRFEWMHQKACPQATLVAFDVLRASGRSVIERSLEERRTLLERMLPFDLPAVLRSKTFYDGAALLMQCEVRQLEGIVAKRLGSRYRPGRRSEDWLKIRTAYGQDVIRQRMENAHS